jgi:formate transporter
MTDTFNTLVQVLQNKQNDSFGRTFYLALWAGIYVAFGGTLYALVTSFSGNPQFLKAFGALLFCIGLILIVFLKAQLFTGNNLMLAPLMTGESKIQPVIKNWLTVYFGNLLGSLLFVLIMFSIFRNFDFVTAHLARIAEIKTELSFAKAFGKAILCNILVCIAVWFAVIGKTKAKKIIGIIIPISAFVYMGFEHSVANMFLIPLGLIFSETTIQLGTQSFLWNILPVTLGNIVGGLLVSSALILLRNRSRN